MARWISVWKKTSRRWRGVRWARDCWATARKRLLPAQQGYKTDGIVKVLDEIATARGVNRTIVAFAWLLKHPSGIIPIVGTTNPERIREAVSATEFEMTREEWYRLFVAARGEPLP